MQVYAIGTPLKDGTGDVFEGWTFKFFSENLSVPSKIDQDKIHDDFIKNNIPDIEKRVKVTKTGTDKMSGYALFTEDDYWETHGGILEANYERPLVSLGSRGRVNAYSLRSILEKSKEILNITSEDEVTVYFNVLQQN